MKKKIRKQVQEIIDKEYETDWEFIVNKIAPEIEEVDFDEVEIAKMLSDETAERNILLWLETKVEPKDREIFYVWKKFKKQNEQYLSRKNK